MFELPLKAIAWMAVGSVLWTASIAAAPRKIAFTGVVTEIDDIKKLLDNSVAANTPFSGYYVFDPETTDSNPDPTVGDYRHTAAVCGIVVQMGSYVFRTDPARVDFLVEVVNREQDNYLLRSYANVCSSPLPVDHIFWQLDDSSGTALSSAALPLDPPDLEAFTQLFGLNVNGGFGINQYFIRGRITAVSVDSSPAPTTPEVANLPGLELLLPTAIGYFYQFESSTNLVDWTPFEEPVLGDGATVSKFISQPANPQVSYRAVIRNQPGATSSSENLVNFTFRGKVTELEKMGGLDDSVAVDSSISGFYTFDRTTPDSNDDPTVGDYVSNTTDSGLVVKVGSYVFRTNPRAVENLIEIVNRESVAGGDSYLLRSRNNVSSRPLIIDEISWQLDNPTSNALTSDHLPPTPPALADFSQTFGLSFQGGFVQAGQSQRFRLRAQIESIEVAPSIISVVPAVQIERARELRIATVTGPLYQFQSSPDNITWTDVDEPIIGTGAMVSKFVSAQAEQNFRVVMSGL